MFFTTSDQNMIVLSDEELALVAGGGPGFGFFGTPFIGTPFIGTPFIGTPFIGGLGTFGVSSFGVGGLVY